MLDGMLLCLGWVDGKDEASRSGSEEQCQISSSSAARGRKDKDRGQADEDYTYPLLLDPISRTF